MSNRRRAREIVLQLLYEADLNQPREYTSARQFINSRLHGRAALTNFAESLYRGTLDHRQQVDQHLARLAKGWAIHRMPATDRNVMRMAGFEILFSVTPGPVAVAEAVVLIKRYGDKNSPRFVNGILDRLLKEYESGTLPATASATESTSTEERRSEAVPPSNRT
ncbi:hypothetical protein SV7mr_29090 [Stieleria bergensis]|uniref:Transcription antitermination protein NusB n=1 Tax=Stieleria bergensis TaxID=2528025 RepID=A0A517SW72_9BACT|nr:hypothetical protein SV7mr_29090 [Planctomycetes bacterium SV_7m_r]